MADRKGAAASRRDDAEFVDENESECKCEFLDARFLATVALDSEHAALDYFYQSPFYLKYRDKALNELIRAGQQVDSQQVGLMFQVTYSNLDDISEALKQMAPLDDLARVQYYANVAIFHITLFSKSLGQSGVTTTPIKVYYIIQGSIFLCPPFGSLVRNRLHESIEHFEKFYDTLNDISAWSATNGYSWEPKPKALDPQIKALCDRYGFKEEHHEDFIRDGSMHVFFLRPQEPLAHRVAHDEIRALAKRLAALQQEAAGTAANQASPTTA